METAANVVIFIFAIIGVFAVLYAVARWYTEMKIRWEQLVDNVDETSLLKKRVDSIVNDRGERTNMLSEQFSKFANRFDASNMNYTALAKRVTDLENLRVLDVADAEARQKGTNGVLDEHWKALQAVRGDYGKAIGDLDAQVTRLLRNLPLPAAQAPAEPYSATDEDDPTTRDEDLWIEDAIVGDVIDQATETILGKTAHHPV